MKKRPNTNCLSFSFFFNLKVVGLLISLSPALTAAAAFFASIGDAIRAMVLSSLFKALHTRARIFNSSVSILVLRCGVPYKA